MIFKYGKRFRFAPSFNKIRETNGGKIKEQDVPLT